MIPRTTGRIVGGLFLSAFFLYGGGSLLILSSNGNDAALPENAASLWQLCAGSALLLLNSAAVLTIGALAFRVLRREYRRTASAYLTTRTVEAVLLALAPLGTLLLALSASGSSGPARTLVENADTAYWVAMTTLGVGSLFFCLALLKSGLLPPVLAAGGVAGYAIFALGGVLELSGVGVGLILSGPGALFEVSAGMYLLVKGFRAVVPAGTVSHRNTRSTTTTSQTGTGAGRGARLSDAR